MQIININDIKGKVINQNINERTIKLLVSQKSKIKRENFSIGMSIIAPGKVHEKHSHTGSQEIMIVISGKAIGEIAGCKVNLSVGDVVDIGDSESHTFTNISDEDLKLLWIYSPPGTELKFCD